MTMRQAEEHQATVLSFTCKLCNAVVKSPNTFEALYVRIEHLSDVHKLPKRLSEANDVTLALAHYIFIRRETEEVKA